jgi:ferredoxin-thioredoxin reductase catalytic chain
VKRVLKTAKFEKSTDIDMHAKSREQVRSNRGTTHPGGVQQALITRESLLDLLHQYATQHEIQLNPHAPTLLREVDGLLENLQNYGYLICPCRMQDITGDLVRDKKISCPCAYHKREIESVGYCKCELFVAPLGDTPGLVSTTIHRVEISKQLTTNSLEVVFEKPGWNKGEVKVFIPSTCELVSVEVDSPHDHELSDHTLNDQILFFSFGFADDARLIVRFARKP